MMIALKRLAQNRLIFVVAFMAALGAFVALGLNLSLNSSEGPDEVAHYFFNRFIADYGRLPLTDAERLEAGYKADLPPLYYLAVGGLGYALDLAAEPHFKTNRDNLRLSLVTGHENIKAWRAIRTEDPLAGEVLLWQVGRWMSLFFGVVGLLLIFALLRVCFPQRPWLALSGMTVAAFMSAYAYISSITSYELLGGALMAAYFLALAAMIRRPRRKHLYFLSGLLIGLAAVNRHTPWPALALVPALILWMTYSSGQSWKIAVGRLLSFGLGVTLTFGWWVLYIALFFNKIEQLGLVNGLLSPLLIGDGSGHTSQQIASVMTGGQIGIDDVPRRSDSLLTWAWAFFSGLWGRGWLGWVMLAVWGVALAGLAARWRSASSQLRLWLALLLAHIGAILLFPLLRFVFSGSANTAMSQHILFPAGAAIMLLLIYGLTAFPRLSNFVPAFLFGLAMIYAGQQFAGLSGREFTIFPITTQPIPVEISAPDGGLAHLGELTLLDAGLEPAANGQALRAVLWWRAEEYPADDYELELTLLDAAGQPQTQWRGQPLAGRYPARAWQPGDRVRSETRLPIAGLPAGDYRLQLRLLKSPDAATPVDLGEIELIPASLSATGRLQVAGQSIEFRQWPGPLVKQQNGLPLYGENGVVTISTVEPVDPTQVQLTLLGPDGQPHPPLLQIQNSLIFSISPQMAAGLYALQAQTAAGQTAVSEPLLAVETEERLFAPDQAIANPLDADFAGYVSLLGYNLPATTVQPGSALSVEYFWQAQRTIGADLIQFNHLIGPNGKQWGGRDRQPREVYSTMYWSSEEVISDQYNLEIPADAPAGSYYLLVGFYLPVGESSVSLPLVQDGQLSDVTHVSIGPIEVSRPDTGE